MLIELGMGHEPLACYAEKPNQTRGRDYDTDESERRTCFQRDRDRILHSKAFRRLKDKTQLFTYPDNDHIRNRLTHSLEVAQIARSIARCLKLNEDLTEAIALAHDLGHAPFGHDGEKILDELLENNEGFDHNAQSFRIVTNLEQSYFENDGLNLSWETLEGIIKHNGPLTNSEGKPLPRFENGRLPFGITSYPFYENLQLHLFGSAEAQVATIADDIAYIAHDIDDGLRAKLIKIEELKNIQPLNEIIEEVERNFIEVESKGRKILDQTYNNEIVRRIIRKFTNDVIDTSNSNLSEKKPGKPDEIRNAGRDMITFSIEGKNSLDSIKDFQIKRMYKHDKVITAKEHGKTIIKTLFKKYIDEPKEMKKWFSRFSKIAETDKSRVVAEYIAGFSDKFAISEYERLCSPSKLVNTMADEDSDE